MGNTPLILAALAKAAVPSLNIAKVGALGGSDAERIVVITTTDGNHYEVRMPRTRQSLAELEAELRALAALSESARARLPFTVAALVGQTQHPKGAAALVVDHISGREVDLGSISPSGTLAESIGDALGAIHNLPLEVVADANLPEYSPADIAVKYVNELDRIAATGKVPPALLDRWQEALEDVSLFRYQPTVVHGSLDPDSVLWDVIDHAELVSGVLNWNQLHIGDPAEDFAWIFGAARPELTDSVLMSYNTRHPNNDEMLRHRGQLYSELALGRYLLRGVEDGNEEIVADMVQVLDDLLADLNEGHLPHLGKVEAPILAAPVLAEPLFEASDLVADASGALEDAELDSLEEIMVGDAAEADEADAQHDFQATAPIEVVEPTGDADASADGSDEADLVDDKTRPIELPAKTDNELF